jgi:glutathione synthase/RimK-type ligase-like ATP-grasp enzyme
MDQDIDLCHREEKFLAQLRDRGLRDRESLFQEIYQRIRLDVFGIDFALVNDQVVVFEANACMHFLGRGNTSSPRYSYNDTYKKALRSALKKMLVRA